MSNNLKQDNAPINPGWLNQFFSKTSNGKSTLPFSIFSMPVVQLKKEFTIPSAFTQEILGYDHLVAIYLPASSYKRERLLYYHSDPRFRSISDEDFACKLICKMKLISISNSFDQAAEQHLGLSMGIINRPQLKAHFDVKFIDEKIYYNLKVKFAYHDDRELVHVIAFKPLEGNALS
ncbi:hypothetical protein [Pedobacter ghigonis]|uniref:hypothetical protein n=1 Tax=Pedobacter ghigonis TaxID=2730403 RepID=UPI00158A9E7C|nr:hypothetical protein [Pedobacter ghigonis]